MAYKHARVIDLQEPARQFLRRAYDAMTRMGWYIQSTTEQSIRAKIPETFSSQGQVIIVTIVSESQVEVVSHNPLRTQVVDWGKNKKNVELLLRQIDQTQ